MPRALRPDNMLLTPSSQDWRPTDERNQLLLLELWQ